VIAPKGAIPSDFVEGVRANKLALIQHLHQHRIARQHETNVIALKQVAGEDWSEISQDPEKLEAFADAFQKSRHMAQGIVPSHYTALIACRHCGVVPCFPTLDEQNSLLGCPWCFHHPLNQDDLLDQWARAAFDVTLHEMRIGCRKTWKEIKDDPTLILQLAIDTRKQKRFHSSPNR